MSVPQFKQLRRAYGFDEVAIVPGDVTINPELVELGLDIGPHRFSIPFVASAMDAVVDPNFAIEMHRAGGLAVLNLEGVWTRYDDPGTILQEVAAASRDEATAILQNAYQAPIRDDLIARRIREIKAGGAVAAVSTTPMNTKKMAGLVQESGADILVVQSTVTTARHESNSIEGLRFDRLLKDIHIPVVVGNTVGFNATLEVMRTGVAGVLVGVGPGAACTSREVLGIGVPQVTATIDCAAARDHYFHESGRYVPIITDGGIRTGGDVCKCIVSGADAVMMGSPFAQTTEAPGRGYHWGMATPHANLPRGTRVAVGVNTTVQKLLYGPTSRTDGTENLVGALKTAMGMCGAHTVREFQQAEMVIAPAIKTEGKIYQFAQSGA
ncbi:MAG: GuaB3 family IMP dehydrogenase-related protein [Chloroflexi bacterium CFX7]|nr:MAG: GuaB3 family IMP dehydrogenase-related protein [bacterium]MCE7927899.1 GuaB3 family IMP dehydrogenase-related protein [Chloroflexi bacterium CFX7]MCK6564960.1 GuaB3 family IMP dehydrogenase-related protein [Dehalococcoidia bacterium]MCL4232311.1 GuaB3 family IMP dehydrogenase-related protein [Dehalococcoidia bacterium]RIL04234.1 MAG: GuaB3 family IMP dehydrogenase-related protein [bacterium]